MGGGGKGIGKGRKSGERKERWREQAMVQWHKENDSVSTIAYYR